MVLPIGDRRPFSMPVVKHGTLAAAAQSISGTMITRAPWPSPVNKYYVLRKIVATQTTMVSGGFLSVWDQDMSNTTPVSRGSAGGPLLQIPITPLIQNSGVFINSAATMTTVDIDACPQEFFQAGITIQQNVSGTVNVSLELDVI